MAPHSGQPWRYCAALTMARYWGNDFYPECIFDESARTLRAEAKGSLLDIFDARHRVRCASVATITSYSPAWARE